MSKDEEEEGLTPGECYFAIHELTADECVDSGRDIGYYQVVIIDAQNYDDTGYWNDDCTEESCVPDEFCQCMEAVYEAARDDLTPAQARHLLLARGFREKPEILAGYDPC